ncbi:unnamed protein product [Protopolystoma xenopodis]|uniref:Uncharacterized protein n=1 Tax=Protopolystoma xenopodis TaxID=117903 RepID=A0A3S5CHC2_9PLAT|nr:unnamed protein product [Protopolystoma xenopodis]
MLFCILEIGSLATCNVSVAGFTSQSKIDSEGLKPAVGLDFDPNFHRMDEQVNVHLEPGSEGLAPLTRKFLRLSSKATVTHLRKYIALQVLDDISKFNEF